MKSDLEIVYDVKEKRGILKDVLEKLLCKWQNKLGMDEWKLDLKIVDFKRKDGYRQSGDFVADCENKIATILMTWDPWRGDEEYTLVHELVHVLVYDYDKYSENLISKKYDPFGKELDLYMSKLENLVHNLTQIFLGRSDGSSDWLRNGK